jgi:hypothetical protein
MKVPARDMSIHVAYLDLHLAIVAQGVSYSPDVADDMVGRMAGLLDESIGVLAEYGLIGEQEEDEEYGPTPERELIDPRIVYVEDEDYG